MDVFYAVADPTRRTILDTLAGGERAAGELVERFPDLSQPAVSRHLRILLEVGLVTVRAEAQRRIYALNPQRLVELDTWLKPYQRFWDERLAALDQHLARKHGQKTSQAKSSNHASSRQHR
jgi:DNA-binding transcriptional ArsR family regulator